MFYRTAESVSPKHPDKLCDQISDAILDAYLKKDSNARVAAEACGGHGVVFVTGEITSTAENIDIPAIVKRIAGDGIEVHTKIVKQSPEIAQGVDTGGAGDQGIMIGYACNETPEMLPREVVLSRELNQFIYDKHPYDGKTQVTIAPDGSLSSVVASFQTLVASLLNWFHSWYIPHSVTINKDEYLATDKIKAKMWTLMVNHANYADLVITPSNHFRKKLEYYGVKKAVKVYPNGIAEHHYPKNPKIRTLGSNDVLNLIWHSRVSREKRIMPFLESLKYLGGNYRLDVYGDGNDLAKAKRYALRNNMNVIFHGNTSYRTLAAKLPKAHLDVLVSYDYDTFGMTLIEAESYGVPVFFCDPDMKEIVPSGGYIMSKDKTPESMAKALNKAIENPDLIEQMSKVMLEHREEVLVSNRIHILEKIFNDIISL